jgi:phosphopentomutase
MGLSRLVDLKHVTPAASPTAAFGRMAERSKGKDSVTGHWELMGIVLDRAFPTFPDGFPAGLINEFEKRIVDNRSATSSPPAPRSSTSSDRNTWRRAFRSSIRRRQRVSNRGA